MNGKSSDFFFYLSRGLMVILGLAALAFELWFMDLYYLYANMIVLPICLGLSVLGVEAADSMRKKYRNTL